MLLLGICVLAKRSFVQRRSCILRDMFRTRHRHLRLPSPAQSAAPERGDFGRARQQKPQGANRRGQVMQKDAQAPAPDKTPLSDCNLSMLSKQERAPCFPQAALGALQTDCPEKLG